jgi:hypothetical protein
MSEAVGRLALGLQGSLGDHRGFMHKLQDLESAMRAQLGAADGDLKRPAPELGPLLLPAEAPQQARERKRRRRKFARAALGAIERPSLATLVSLAPTILADDTSDEEHAEPELQRTPRALTVDPTVPYSPNRHSSPFVATPSSGGQSGRPPRRAAETRTALDVAAANRRGGALWAAALRRPATEASSGSRFDIYRMLSAAWVAGSAQREAIGARLQEALDVPTPYGVQLHQAEAVEAVHRAVCAHTGQRLSKLQLFALVTPAAEDDSFAVGGPPPGRRRADVEGWMAREAARDAGPLPASRRLAHEAAAAVRPPAADLTRDQHAPLARSPGGNGFEPRPPPVEQVVLATPPWPASEQLLKLQTELDDTRVRRPHRTALHCAVPCHATPRHTTALWCTLIMVDNTSAVP